MATTSLYDAIKDQGSLFNVEEQPIFLANSQKPIDGRKAIVNLQTGNTLAVVSSKYRVVSNEEVVRTTLEAIEHAQIDTTDATVNTSFSNGGARSMVRIVLPAYSIMSANNKTNLEIVTLNSYDGAWKYSTRAGGIRIACLNGQVLGKMIGAYSQYHNQNLDVRRGAENLTRMISDFSKSEDWFNMMRSRAVDTHSARIMIGKFLDLSGTQLDESRAAQKLLVLWDAYATEMGANAYALYNAFTDFITHRSRHKTAVAKSRLYDENAFSRKILDSSMFH